MENDFSKCPKCGWLFSKYFKGKMIGTKKKAYSCGTYTDLDGDNIVTSWKCVENQNELLQAKLKAITAERDELKRIVDMIESIPLSHYIGRYNTGQWFYRINEPPTKQNAYEYTEADTLKELINDVEAKRAEVDG